MSLSSLLLLQDPTHVLPTEGAQQTSVQGANFSEAETGSERLSELLRVTQLALRSLSKTPPHTQPPRPPSEGTHLQATDAGRAGVRLEHDLDVLEYLITSRPRPGHLVSHLLGSFLQLEIGRGQAVSDQSGASSGGSGATVLGQGSHSPAASVRLAACTSSQPAPHRSWPGPPSPPRSSTPPGYNAA